MSIRAIRELSIFAAVLAATIACEKREEPPITIVAEVPRGAYHVRGIKLAVEKRPAIAPVAVRSFKEESPDITVVVLVQATETFLDPINGAASPHDEVMRAIDVLMGQVPSQRLQTALLVYNRTVRTMSPLEPRRLGASSLVGRAWFQGQTETDLVQGLAAAAEAARKGRGPRHIIVIGDGTQSVSVSDARIKQLRTELIDGNIQTHLLVLRGPTSYRKPMLEELFNDLKKMAWTEAISGGAYSIGSDLTNRTFIEFRVPPAKGKVELTLTLDDLGDVYASSPLSDGAHITFSR